MAEIVEYRCPQCGRSFEEMRGALMSDMGREPAERRERRRLFMCGQRDRLHGIKRASAEPLVVGDERFVGLDGEEPTCRRCGAGMEPGARTLVGCPEMDQFEPRECPLQTVGSLKPSTKSWL